MRENSATTTIGPVAATALSYQDTCAKEGRDSNRSVKTRSAVTEFEGRRKSATTAIESAASAVRLPETTFVLVEWVPLLTAPNSRALLSVETALWTEGRSATTGTELVVLLTAKLMQGTSALPVWVFLQSALRAAMASSSQAKSATTSMSWDVLSVARSIQGTVAED